MFEVCWLYAPNLTVSFFLCLTSLNMLNLWLLNPFDYIGVFDVCLFFIPTVLLSFIRGQKLDILFNQPWSLKFCVWTLRGRACSLPGLQILPGLTQWRCHILRTLPLGICFCNFWFRALSNLMCFCHATLHLPLLQYLSFLVAKVVLLKSKSNLFILRMSECRWFPVSYLAGEVKSFTVWPYPTCYSCLFFF